MHIEILLRTLLKSNPDLKSSINPILYKFNGHLLPELSSISAKVNFTASDYTYENFLEDYHFKILQYQEKEILFNIWMSGRTICSFCSDVGIAHSSFIKFLEGDQTLSSATIKKIGSTLSLFSNLRQDLTPFEIILKENFCKLIGNIEDLQSFLDKYKIDEIVLPYKNCYHIAFNGLVYEQIKKLGIT